jgi:hypothetical protein
MEKGESFSARRFPLVDLSESPYSPEARETRRISANVGKKKEASSNAPCAPENKWGGDVKNHGREEEDREEDREEEKVTSHRLRQDRI